MGSSVQVYSTHYPPSKLPSSLNGISKNDTFSLTRHLGGIPTGTTQVSLPTEAAEPSHSLSKAALHFGSPYHGDGPHSSRTRLYLNGLPPIQHWFKRASPFPWNSRGSRSSILNIQVAPTLRRGEIFPRLTLNLLFAVPRSDAPRGPGRSPSCTVYKAGRMNARRQPPTLAPLWLKPRLTPHVCEEPPLHATLPPGRLCFSVLENVGGPIDL